MQRKETVYVQVDFRERMVGVNSYEACIEGVFEQRGEEIVATDGIFQRYME